MRLYSQKLTENLGHQFILDYCFPAEFERRFYELQQAA